MILLKTRRNEPMPVVDFDARTKLNVKHNIIEAQINFSSKLLHIRYYINASFVSDKLK